MTERPVSLTIVDSEAEAELACGLLRANAIKCGSVEIQRVGLPESIIGTGSLGAPRFEILVDEQDLEAAKKLLADTAASA